MFNDPTIVGSWLALAARLDNESILAQWAAIEPPLSGLATVDELLAFWAEDCEGDRTDAVLAALVRLASVDGAGDDDALLLSLHLLSGLVWGLVRQLQHLTSDGLAMVVAELTCQIRGYPWRRRPRSIAANLRVETRNAVMTDLQPSSRSYPDRVEVLTLDGDVAGLCVACTEAEPDLDIVDLLEWAVRSGVDAGDIALLVATECGRDRGQWRADEQVAALHGIAARTLYRRRQATLAALRAAAADYLAAVA